MSKTVRCACGAWWLDRGEVRTGAAMEHAEDRCGKPAASAPPEASGLREGPGTPLRALIDKSYRYMQKRDDGTGWEGSQSLVREAYRLGAASASPDARGLRGALRECAWAIRTAMTPGTAESGEDERIRAALHEAERLAALAATPDARPDPDERGPMTWGVSTDEESFHGHYATKEEALAAAPSELDLAPGQRFWVGGGRPYRPTRSVDVDSLLERLADDAGDACGEIAEGWPDPGTMARIGLEKEAHAAVMRVLQHTGNLPAFYCCEVVEEHTAAALPPSPGTPEVKPDLAATAMELPPLCPTCGAFIFSDPDGTAHCGCPRAAPAKKPEVKP